MGSASGQQRLASRLSPQRPRQKRDQEERPKIIACPEIPSLCAPKSPIAARNGVYHAPPNALVQASVRGLPRQISLRITVDLSAPRQRALGAALSWPCDAAGVVPAPNVQMSDIDRTSAKMQDTVGPTGVENMPDVFRFTRRTIGSDLLSSSCNICSQTVATGQTIIDLISPEIAHQCASTAVSPRPAIGCRNVPPETPRNDRQVE